VGIEEEKLVVERCPLPVARGRVRVDSNWPDGNPTASVAQALFQGSERVAFISPNRITAAAWNSSPLFRTVMRPAANALPVPEASVEQAKARTVIANAVTQNDAECRIVESAAKYASTV